MADEARAQLTLEAGCGAEDGGHAPLGGIKTVTSATVLLSSMSLGVGVFTLPTVCNTVGWTWGFGLIFLFGLLSLKLMLNILEVCIAKNCRTWEEVASLAPLGRPLSNLSLFLSYLIGNAAHLQVVSGILFDLMSLFVTGDFGQTAFDIKHRLVIYVAFFCIAMPFCCQEDLGSLRHIGKAIAAVVLATCLLVVALTLGRTISGDGAHGAAVTPTAINEPQVLLASAPNVCFAFTGMLCLWEVFVAARNGVGIDGARSLMRRSVWCSSLLVMSVYLAVTLGAVLAFGAEAGMNHKGNGLGNLLYNFLPQNMAVTVMSLLIVVVIVLEYPIINFPLVNMVLRIRRLKLSRYPWSRSVVSVLVMGLIALLDTAVPNLPDVFGLCGSLGLAITCYLLPGLILIGHGGGLQMMVTGALAVAVGLLMLFGGTFFILKRVITGKA